MTDEQYTEQARRHLAAYMERQRQASQILEQGFRDDEISAPVDAGAAFGNEDESDYEDAKEAARQYAQARNSGTRVRAYAQDNESQREGVQAALSWLQRKKKSAIKK